MKLALLIIRKICDRTVVHITHFTFSFVFGDKMTPKLNVASLSVLFSVASLHKLMYDAESCNEDWNENFRRIVIHHNLLLTNNLRENFEVSLFLTQNTVIYHLSPRGEQIATNNT